MGTGVSTPIPDGDPAAGAPAPAGAGGGSLTYHLSSGSGGGGAGPQPQQLKAGRRRRRSPSASASASSSALSDSATASTSGLSPTPPSPTPEEAEYAGGRRKHLKPSTSSTDGGHHSLAVGESGGTASTSDDEEGDVEVIAPCRTDDEGDDSMRALNGGEGDLQIPRMSQPVNSAYCHSPATPQQAVCWGWLPRSLSARSSHLPAISVVSDESGGSGSTTRSGGDGSSSWYSGQGTGGGGREEEEEARAAAGSNHLQQGDDTPRAGQYGRGGGYGYGYDRHEEEQAHHHHHLGHGGGQQQHPSAFAPVHPLSSKLESHKSFMESSSSAAARPPPRRSSSRKSKSESSSVKSSSRGSSSREAQETPPPPPPPDADAGFDCQESCLPRDCIPSLPDPERQQDCLPDLTCGVGELAQANWEAFSSGTACSGGFGEWSGAVVGADAPTPAVSEVPISGEGEPAPAHSNRIERVISPEESARRRQRDELLASAAGYERSGDHSAALQCYERCLTEYHHHSLAPAHNSSVTEGQAIAGAPIDVVVVPSSASVEVADVLHRIGVVHWKTGGYDESVRVLRESLAVYRRHLRPRIDDTRTTFDSSTGREVKVNADADALAGILNSLGRVHLSRGECGAAMRAYQESLSIQEAVYSDPSDLEGDDLSTGTGMTFDTQQTGLVSKSSFASGRSGMSRSLASTSVGASLSSRKSTKSKATKRALASHPGIARTVIAIGMVHDARGNYAKSVRRYKSGLKAQRRALGPDHVDVAATLNAMGLVQEKLDAHDVAERCYEESLRIYRLNLGDSHVDTAVALNNLGQVHHHRGRYDAAMGCYVDALRIMRSVLGDSHRNVAATLHNVGLVHSARGRHDRALKIYREVLRAQRAALGDGHVDVAVTLDSIAESYEGKGRYDRTVKFYSKALRVRRAALGRRHQFVAVTLDRMGRFHVDRDGNLIEARRRLGEARELYLENGADGEDDPRVREVEEYLDKCERMMATQPEGGGGNGGGVPSGRVTPEMRRSSSRGGWDDEE